MMASIQPAKLKQTRWYEFAIRFVLGGLITVIAGLVARRFGPELGGLFLAFPAIFPASVTLVEKHERERKHSKGLHGTRRGREMAALDSFGATMGSVALALFAVIVWQAVPHWSAVLTILAATGIWLVSALALWKFRHALHCPLRALGRRRAENRGVWRSKPSH